jgi:sec-independent protein translocase protein TatA
MYLHDRGGHMTAFIGGIGPWEMGVVLIIVMILFGAGKLPQVFRSMGEGMKAFKDGQRDGTLDGSVDPKTEQD